MMIQTPTIATDGRADPSAEAGVGREMGVVGPEELQEHESFATVVAAGTA